MSAHMNAPLLLLAATFVLGGCTATPRDDSESSGAAISLGSQFTSPLKSGVYDAPNGMLYITPWALSQHAVMDRCDGSVDVDLSTHEATLKGTVLNEINLTCTVVLTPDGDDIVAEGVRFRPRKAKALDGVYVSVSDGANTMTVTSLGTSSPYFTWSLTIAGATFRGKASELVSADVFYHENTIDGCDVTYLLKRQEGKFSIEMFAGRNRNAACERFYGTYIRE